MLLIFLLIIVYVRADFAVIGDWGGHQGTTHQSRVAAVLESTNPDFVVSTGDSFYPNGIAHASDPNIQRLWVDIYNMSRPWVSVLGNHDYLNNASAQLHIPHTNWHMPSRYYKWTFNDIDFWFLDTTPWMPFNYVEAHQAKYGDLSDATRADFEAQRQTVPEQIAWLRASMASSTASRKFVVGHHPLWTYGYHRHANHSRLQDVVLDLHHQYGLEGYLCGHDHNLQHIRLQGLDEYLSGAGSSSFEVFSGPGLMYKTTTADHGFVVVHDNKTVSFVDSYGHVVHQSHNLERISVG